MALNLLYILAGLALLVGGAQALVRGASRMALALGISPLIVGLTIVAFGTSAPELSVSIRSCLAGKSSIVLGNVLGSNIYNVLFILGVCATITPLAVSPQLIRLDVPIMIACAVALPFLSLDDRLGRIDGSVLIAGLVAYTVFTIRQSRKERPAVSAEYEGQLRESLKPDRKVGVHILFMIGGLALLGVGSDLLVRGAVAIAQALKVSEVVIGMTIVTLGTTAPELSACLVAALKGERDIAVGNIVGSNIFNVLAVLGAGAIVAPGGIEVPERMLDFGMPVMAVVCFSCLPVFFAGQAIRRWEGIVFLLYFVFYIAYLLLEELRHVHLLTLRNSILWFVAPLTVVTLVVSVYREIRSRRRHSESPPPPGR
jgi:cation:H+ antiporter